MDGRALEFVTVFEHWSPASPVFQLKTFTGNGTVRFQAFALPHAGATLILWRAQVATSCSPSPIPHMGLANPSMSDPVQVT